MKFYENQIFDLFHMTYITVSLLITILILIILKKYIKQKKHKDNVLLFFSLSTFLVHLSPLWYSFINHEPAIAIDNMLFPIYFCNLAMFMLLIVSFKKNSESKSFKYIAVSTAYSGTIGAIISLFYPDYYISVTGGVSFGILKSMISHSLMLVGTLYLFTGNYIKIKKENTMIFSVGLIFYGFVGLIVNLIFVLAGYSNPNSMYLVNSPIPELKFLNGYIIGAILIIITLIFNKIWLLSQQKNNIKVKLRPKH